MSQITYAQILNVRPWTISVFSLCVVIVIKPNRLLAKGNKNDWLAKWGGGGGAEAHSPTSDAVPEGLYVRFGVEIFVYDHPGVTIFLLPLNLV